MEWVFARLLGGSQEREREIVAFFYSVDLQWMMMNIITKNCVIFLECCICWLGFFLEKPPGD